MTEKALALAEAGLRATLGQSMTDAVRDVAMDLYGGAPVDRGFDQLLRNTNAGRNLARAIGVELAEAAASAGGAVGYERELARVAASGPDFVALAIAPAGVRVDVTLTDVSGRPTTTARTNPDGTPVDPLNAIASAVLLPLGADAAAPVVGLITAPSASPYTIDLSAPELTAADLAVTLPRGDGTFLRGTFAGATIGPASRARLTVDLARPDALTLETDADADGQYESSQPLVTETIAPEGARLLSATVIGPETISTAGPFGLHVALLFDRVVDAASAADRTRYQIPSNVFRIARRQLSGRLVFGQLEQPEGPYVPTTVAITGLADGRGVVGPAATVPLQSRFVDPGAVVTGRVFHADGVAVASGVIRYLNNVDPTCQYGLPDAALSVLPLGADGRFEFRYVRQDPCGMGFRLYTQDPVTYAVRTLDSRVRAAGERQVLDVALFGTGAVSGVVRDALGAPVGGAAVRVQSGTDPQIWGAALTDGDGRYAIATITVGPVSVTAQKALTLGTAAGRILRAGTTAAIDVTLDTGTAAVAGTVRRLEGGALVQYYLVEQAGLPPRLVHAVLTGAGGAFAFDPVPAGAFFLQATYAGQTYEMTSTSGVVAQGQRLEGLDLVIEAAATATVRGVVRLPDATPVHAALVALADRGVLTDTAGRFELPGVPIRPDRPQTIEAFSADRLRRGQTSVLVTAPGVLEGAVITLSALGTAEITVLQGGVSVANQDVVILADPLMLRGLCSIGCGCALATGATDAAGVVRFTNLPVGVNWLRNAMIAAQSVIRSARSGACFVAARKASPTISNCRSTADRNITSRSYSSRVRPAANEARWSQASSTSVRYARRSRGIQHTPARVHALPEERVPDGALFHEVNPAPEQAFEIQQQTQIGICVLHRLQLGELHDEIQIARLGRELTRDGRSKDGEPCDPMPPAQRLQVSEPFRHHRSHGVSLSENQPPEAGPGVPVLNGFVTFTGSAGTLPPGTQVLVVNEGTGEIASFTADNDGAISGSLFATIRDRLIVTITDPLHWGHTVRATFGSRTAVRFRR